MKKKIIIDKKGVVHSVYCSPLHLMYRKMGIPIHVSSRIGEVYSKGGDWFVDISHFKEGTHGNIIVKIFGPFPTKEEAVKREEQYIEENYLCFMWV